jgi:hypothetical protein
MPVTGRKPKPDGQKRNRVQSPIDWAVVPNVPFDGGPRLPRREQGWPTLTKRWWSTVSSMPHCSLWSDADWQYAIDTAIVAAAFHGGDVRAAAELRYREKQLGTTFDARRDLRIRYVDPAKADAPEGAEDQAEEAPRVANLDDYRASLDD